MKDPEDEAFEELSLKQGQWEHTSGWRKKQILETSMTQEALAENVMRKVQRLGQEIEQEPVAWLLTDKNINSLQVDSIQRLIDRLKHAHHIDIRVRINGQDEWFQADWLKHMVRASPPQRTEKEPVAWPCLIDSADFSENTITLVMQCEDYKVSAGTHWLSTTPPKETT